MEPETETTALRVNLDEDRGAVISDKSLRRMIIRTKQIRYVSRTAYDPLREMYEKNGRALIRYALIFTDNRQRSTIMVDDVNNALRMMNQKLVGFCGIRDRRLPAKRKDSTQVPIATKGRRQMKKKPRAYDDDDTASHAGTIADNFATQGDVDLDLEDLP
jgi:histone H3/H4